MPLAHIIDNPDASNHDYGWRRAFGNGLARHGWQVRDVKQGTTTVIPDLFVIWGVRRRQAIRFAKNAGAEVCVLERGYLGDRLSYTSVSFGGELNGNARFYHNIEVAQVRRWLTMTGVPHDWKEDTGLTVVMGQVPGDQSIRGFDFERWRKNTCRCLEDMGRRVKFRPHPGGNMGRPDARAAASLASDLEAAGQVITWNSNSAVDAVLAGVPTVAQDAGSMAWEVTGRELSDMVKPDRTGWLERLAWKQYSRAEMESGFCAEAVGLHDWERWKERAAAGDAVAADNGYRLI